MNKYKQGDIYFFDFNPSLGSEIKKLRPCVIISNNQYNRIFNTVIVMPISSSDKYQKEEKYQKSPLFYTLKNKKVYGTVLLQHIRTVDPKKYICSDLKDQLTLDEIQKIRQIINQFF